MNAGSGVGQIFTSMTIYTSRSLEAYPITTPPPKSVSDRMCPALIHVASLWRAFKFSDRKKNQKQTSAEMQQQQVGFSVFTVCFC